MKHTVQRGLCCPCGRPGRPFEQMQDAGVQTSQLDRIMRQKDPELLKAVQHLTNNETEKGIALLALQGRITEVRTGADRIAAIARDYAAKSEDTIIVSPDNRSHQQINEAVRGKLLEKGTLAADGQQFQTLTHRSAMSGAERTWAARYEAGNVLQYTTGSKEIGNREGQLCEGAVWTRVPTPLSWNLKTGPASATTRAGCGGSMSFERRTKSLRLAIASSSQLQTRN